MPNVLHFSGITMHNGIFSSVHLSGGTMHNGIFLMYVPKEVGSIHLPILE